MTVSVEQSIINRLVESEPLKNGQSFNKFGVIVSLANNLSYSEFIVIRAEVLRCFSSSTQSEAGSERFHLFTLWLTLGTASAMGFGPNGVGWKRSRNCIL